MTVITNIQDLKRIYERRVPRMFYDYAESGSWTEQTFRENTTDFDQIRLRQRVAVDMTGRTTNSQMIGEDVSMPVALAPVGLTGMQNADGEIKAAQAAEEFGVPFTLSTMSICSIEDVAEHTTKPFWFQVYTVTDDDFNRRLLDRARAANCSAIVVTVDLQIMGQRHKDLKNGLSAPPKLTPKSVLNMMTKVPWGLEMLQTKRRFFGNIVGHAAGVEDAASLSSWTCEAFDQSLDWARIAEIKEMWGGKMIIKGILDAEDAKMAAKVGADAIVVSNHGGRQLDGALSSIRMLPRIMDAVGDEVEVHLDSGIRSGQDVLKALALGAKGTMIGRAFVYGL
ncbi:MAG: alpha-hydroxy acid oxidase, partial [Parasphingorhabdus sp.]|uniref:alpha-hydroxy acid oxidase n=1 Tax=Parasphingorhabdus sp. TaxID=2709688 RepID=UPI003298A133